MSISSTDSAISEDARPFRTGAMFAARLGAVQWLVLCAAALVMAIALGTGYLVLQFRERASRSPSAS